MRPRCHLRPALALAATILAAAGCGDEDPTAVAPPPAHLEFSPASVELGETRGTTVDVRNGGGRSIGPVTLLPGPVRTAEGVAPPGARLATSPPEIPTLNPGAVAPVRIELLLDPALAPGSYEVALTARASDGTEAVLPLAFEVVATANEEAVAALDILELPAEARTGDVIRLGVEARDAAGRIVPDAAVAWTLAPAGAGLVDGTGRFVGYAEGEVTLVARAGTASDTATLAVRSRGLAAAFHVVGRGREVVRHTSDLWLHGDFAYTGTWGVRPGPSGQTPGDQLLVWRIADPAAPVRLTPLTVDARTVNDVKVRADGTLAVLTHEGSEDNLNGVTFLDLSDPASPRVLSRFTRNLEPGVHNAWIEGDYAYLVRDGPASGLRILDVSDPTSPREVASFSAGTSLLHDVYVRDGLAFLSHWNAGLVILDVGNGVAGGSPPAPVEVGRLGDLGGQTHNAWYWPEAGYVFVGEEDFATPGTMHVVDARDLRRPREVATFAVPGQTPHNFWLDEQRAVLYLAWYGQGVHALDVSGELLGELDRQGRLIASSRYGGGNGACNLTSEDTCAWAPQLHRGVVWVSDMNVGLVALAPPG